MIPLESNLIEVRVWFENKMVHSFTLPAAKFRGVHF